MVEEVFKMTLVNASIKSGDEVIVKAEMKIALSDIDSVEKYEKEKKHIDRITGI